MPDFNKGDFTQQGVNGHVNATVRLNEKRLVNIDLTSNEEAEGCTISGAVTDLLNNEVYPIGAGVSGNIEITENGENINVAPYATATVNVSGGGGSDIRICTAKIINNNTDEPVYEVAGALGGFTLIDNVLYEGVLDIEQSTTSTRDYVVRVNTEDFTPALYYVCFYDDTAPVTISEMINCKISENQYMGKIVEVIDPSEDCSFTATISNAA